MQKKTLNLFAVAALSATLVLASCGGTETKEAAPETKATTDSVTPPPADTKPTTPATVVDIAVGSADHSTLVAAVKAAGLVETLSGAGPFTVFAPTNAAFDKLPKATLESLLTPEKKADLTSILTYHVVAGNVKAADLKDGQVVKTLNGKDLKVTIKDGKVSINGANVTAADLSAGNGVVHVIDTVLLPK